VLALRLYPPNAAMDRSNQPSEQPSRLTDIVQVFSSPHTSVRLHRGSAFSVFEVVMLGRLLGAARGQYGWRIGVRWAYGPEDSLSPAGGKERDGDLQVC
jgi:hypothetical protein